MKIKHIIIIFILGYIFITLGALLKIMHWPKGNLIISIGSFLKIFAGGLLIWKTLTNKKFKDILNQ